MIALREMVGKLTVFRPRVPLDLGGVGAFCREVMSRLQSDSRVVLDLGGVTHLDGAGCAAILACWRHVDPDGLGRGDVKLRGLTKQARSIVELVRMHKVLDIFNSLSEAIHSFESAGRPILTFA